MTNGKCCKIETERGTKSQYTFFIFFFGHKIRYFLLMSIKAKNVQGIQKHRQATRLDCSIMQQNTKAMPFWLCYDESPRKLLTSFSKQLLVSYTIVVNASYVNNSRHRYVINDKFGIQRKGRIR